MIRKFKVTLDIQVFSVMFVYKEENNMLCHMVIDLGSLFSYISYQRKEIQDLRQRL